MQIITNQLYLNQLVKIKSIVSLTISVIAQIFTLQYIAYSAYTNGCSYIVHG